MWYPHSASINKPIPLPIRPPLVFKTVSEKSFMAVQASSEYSFKVIKFICKYTQLREIIVEVQLLFSVFRPAFDGGLSPNDGANAAGACLLQTNQHQLTQRGRRGGIDQNRGGTTSFWAIDDATAPDSVEAIFHQPTRPRLTMARCWANHYSNRYKKIFIKYNKILNILYQIFKIIAFFIHYNNSERFTFCCYYVLGLQ